MDIKLLLVLLKPILEERISVGKDINRWLIPFLVEPNCDLEDLKYKSLSDYKDILLVMNHSVMVLNYLVGDWKSENLEKEFRLQASQLQIKAGTFFFPVRVAITGSRISLPLFETMEALGKEEVLKRIKKVIKRLEEDQSGC